MLQFDWQKRDEDFVKWMFVHLIADKRQEDPRFETLSSATKGFTDVQITMQVNGIEVNAQNFIESVENAYRQHAERTAKDLVRDMPRMQELEDVLAEAQRQAKSAIEEAFARAGIDLDLDDDY